MRTCVAALLTGEATPYSSVVADQYVDAPIPSSKASHVAALVSWPGHVTVTSVGVSRIAPVFFRICG
jgi:hypothetical protein